MNFRTTFCSGWRGVLKVLSSLDGQSVGDVPPGQRAKGIVRCNLRRMPGPSCEAALGADDERVYCAWRVGGIRP